MANSVIQAIKDVVKSRWGSALQQIQAFADQVSEALDDKIGFGYLLTSLSLLEQYGTSEVSEYWDDLCDFLNGLITSGTNQLTIVTDAANEQARTIILAKMPLFDNWFLFKEYGTDNVYFSLKDANIKAEAFWDDLITGINLSMIAENFMSNLGVNREIVQLCDYVAKITDWTDLVKVTTVISGYLDGLHSSLKYYVKDIISALSAGPEGFLDMMLSIYQPVQEATTSGSIAPILSTTNIVVNNFAWGAVATAVGAILTAAGTVIMFFSRIVGAIVSVIGVATSTILKIVSNAHQSIAGTRFTVHAGQDAAGVFSFVISQGSFTSEYIASWMRAKGICTCSFLITPSASEVYFYLSSDDPSDNTITYEEHLSTCFSLSGLWRTSYLGNQPGDNHSILWLHNGEVFREDESRYCIVNTTGFHPSSISSVADVKVGLGAYVPAAGRDVQLPNLELLAQAAYSPVSFNFWDSVASVFEDNSTHASQLFILERLCSAIIIWTQYHLDSFMKYNRITLPYGNDWSVFNVFADGSDGGAYLWWWRINGLQQVALNIYYDTQLSEYVLKDEAYSSNLVDDLVNYIKGCFDGLYWINCFTDYGTNVTEFLLTEVSLSSGGSKSYHEYTVHTLTQSDFYDDTRANPYYFHNYIYSKAYSDFIDIFYSSNWPYKFAIDIPTLTFSGYIKGLIVDGLIVLAAVTISILAVVGYKRISNYRAKLAAKAEADRYYWENNGQTDEQWKSYKKSVLKYNLLALGTGSAMISTNINTSGTTYADVKHALAGHESNTDNREYTILDVLKLIKSNY